MPRLSGRIKGYVLAIVSVVLAIAVTAAIPFNTAPSYLLLLLAVFVTAWYSTPLAAFAAIVVTSLLSTKIFHEPLVDFIPKLVLFVAASTALTLWASREKRLQAALEQSNSRFQLLMKNVIDYAIIITDPNGFILDISSGAKRIIGLDAADKGASLRMIFPPEENGAFEDEFGTAETKGESRDERWHLRKNGSRFWGFGILTALRDSGGIVKGYVKILRDLTEQKTSEEERIRLFEELENSNSILQQMVATLAHDIRAPLTATLGWTALRRSGHMNTPDKVDQAFEVIERNARKQLELMEGLLELYRVKARHEQADFTPCNLSEVVYDAAETVRPVADGKGVQVDLFDCDSRMISGNAAWLTQIFTNLLQNAVKFTPAGGRVRVTCVRSPTAFRVEITDTGIGIPANLLSDIFLPFKRGTANLPGAGLGLAIVRELVERHGGTVSASSPGKSKGATFVVELPRPQRDQKYVA